MRRFLISTSLVLLAAAVPQHGFSQGADSTDASTATADTSDLFLNAYMANEQGEKLEGSGDTAKALEKYRYAASLLDQISHDDPKWQPIVVDYRKKRVSENITRVQQQAGAEPPSAGPEAGSVPLEGDLPQKEGAPGPDLGDNPLSIPSHASEAPPSGHSRSQIQELQDDLRDSRQKLKSMETEKEALAGRLDQALKQLDGEKVSETELKGQLKQAQDSYQNSLSDHSQASGGSKQYQQRISQLEEALKDAAADRDAADEQNADYSRRATKARQATSQIAQQRDAATAHAQDLQSKFADASKLAAKLDAANKQIAALGKDRDAATQRADDLDKQLAGTSKIAAKLADAQKQIAALKAGATQTTGKNSEIAGKLADARKQIEQITADRDTARGQVTALNGKLADAQSQIVSVKAERDQIATQRDQALAELGKARAAEKRVNELLADNTTLTQKLATDDKIIKDFKSNSPDKDKQIAELRKEVGDTKALLASAQQEKDSVQSTLNDLQQQYDSTTAELTELKANNAVSSTEKKTLTDENGILRNIVVRQLKAQALRDQTKRLVMDELSQLNVQSDTLLKRINYLGEPVVQLTDKEKALFKDPTLDLPDADDSSMEIAIAAPKQTAPAPVVDTVSKGAPAPGASDSTPASTPVPEPSAAPESSPAPHSPSALDAEPTPSATPMELARRTTPGSPESVLSTPAPNHPSSAPASSPAAGQPESTVSPGSTPPVAGTPMVPPELMDQAKNAKDAFEKEDYRGAEKLYEKMLTKAPTNVYILSNLGVVYFRNEKWQLAEESLKKAIAVAPEDTFSWCTLGIVYYQEKRYDDAINALTRALAINPKYAVAHNYLGITASQKGWQEAALKELETAIEYDPNYGDACFNLAVVYAMEQPPNKELARKYYKRATDLGAEPDPGLDQMLK
jgi:Flp pilus assembly protein TadD/predicted  nucleic acid-binding Zn-ribbon protein